MRNALAGGFAFFLGLAESCAQTDSLRPWPDYQVIMWVSGKTVAKPEKVPLVLQRLREMGVTAGMVTGDGDASAYTKAGMPFYVENIVRTGLCLKFRSPVTDWSKFVNEWMETRNESAFVRPYCLEDPAWLAESKKRMRDVVGFHKANAPLLYDIRDELSVTTSANPFDYDFSPQSLAGFRKWLQKEYESLEALNKQWDTDFASWEAVRPFSTDQIKARMVTGERMPKGPPDWSALKQIKFDPVQAAKEPVKWNFAPWCDFRTYMDTVLADTLDSLRNAAHGVDPATPVGIEGTQMPHAFGGYDLWKLSQSVDWMEPYDVGNAREILGSFMPGKPMLSTVFEKDTDHAMRRLWHLLLLGDKGCIVWWSEDCVDADKDDLPLTEKAKALAPVFREMQSPLAKLFMVAEREVDPIAIHYSQASIQVAWLLESTVDGKTWPRRFSSHEASHSRHAAVRNGWLKLLQDLGYTPRFVSTEEIGQDQLNLLGPFWLVMPDSRALTTEERSKIKEWWAAGHVDQALMGGGHTGGFDGHGAHTNETVWRSVETEFVKAKWQYPAAATVMASRSIPGFMQSDLDLADYPKARLIPDRKAKFMQVIGDGLVGLDPHAHVWTDPALCIRTHRYRLGTPIGDVRLLAFERGVDYHMSEDLKQAGGNEPLEKPVSFTATLAQKAHAYDLRSGTYLGEADRIEVNLDPWKPSLFALLPEKLLEGWGVVETLLRDAMAKAR